MKTTLVEFLLARIAEDETAVRMNWNGGTGLTDERWWGTPFQPSRLLSECEARRRIVQRAASARRRADAWTRERLTYDHNSPLPDWAASDALDDTLRDLAHVYAGHPDYDESQHG